MNRAKRGWRALQPRGRPGGIRTHTPLREGDFKSPASAIPPPALDLNAFYRRLMYQAILEIFLTGEGPKQALTCYRTRNCRVSQHQRDPAVCYVFTQLGICVGVLKGVLLWTLRSTT